MRASLPQKSQACEPIDDVSLLRAGLLALMAAFLYLCPLLTTSRQEVLTDQTPRRCQLARTKGAVRTKTKQERQTKAPKSKGWMERPRRVSRTFIAQIQQGSQPCASRAFACFIVAVHALPLGMRP